MDNYNDLKNKIKDEFKNYNRTKTSLYTLLDEIKDDSVLGKIIDENSSSNDEYEYVLSYFLKKSKKKHNLTKININAKKIDSLYKFWLLDINPSAYYMEFYNIFKMQIFNEIINNPDNFCSLINEDENTTKIVKHYFNIEKLQELFNESDSYEIKNNIISIYKEIQLYDKKEIDIGLFVNNLSFEEKINLSLIDKEDFDFIIKDEIKRINNVEDKELLKKVIDKIIKSSNNDNKKSLLNILNYKTIKKLEIEDIRLLYEKIKDKTKDEELIKLIEEKEDNYTIMKINEDIQDNLLPNAISLLKEVHNKHKYKKYILYLLNNYESINISIWEAFYIKEDDEITRLFIDICKKRGEIYYIDSIDFLKKLIEDNKKEFAITVAGFDKKINPLEGGNLYIECLLLLKENNITNSYIDRLYNNYINLKNENKGINYKLRYFLIGLIDDEVSNRFSSKFISDIFEYRKTEVFLRNIKSLYNLEIFLNNNKMYSKSNIYYILDNYNDNKELIDDLLEKNIILTKNEKENFLKHMMSLKNVILLKNYDDLKKYDDFVIKKTIELFENANDKYKVKKILYRILFSYYYINNETRSEATNISSQLAKLSFNTYLQSEMINNNLLDEYDIALLEVIRNIENTFKEENDLQEIKEKYKNIVKNNISLYSTYINLYYKYKNYFQKIIIDESKTGELLKEKEKNIKEENIIKYKDKELKVLELTGEKFRFLIHSLDCFNEHNKMKASEILKNPEKWNGLDYKSSISCSLLDNNHVHKIHYGLGFYKLPKDSLICMSNLDAGLEIEEDGYFNPVSRRGIPFTSPSRLIKFTMNKGIKSFYSLKGLSSNTSHSSLGFDEKLNVYHTNDMHNYNEVAIFRKNSHLKKFYGRVQPDFIFYTGKGEPSEEIKKLAYYFDVPIVKLDLELYQKQYQENTEKYKNRIIDNFNIDDVRNILETKEFSEEESINIIMDYIDKMELDNTFIEKVRKELINYYISEYDMLNEALRILDEHISKKEQNHEYR